MPPQRLVQILLASFLTASAACEAPPPPQPTIDLEAFEARIRDDERSRTEARMRAECAATRAKKRPALSEGELKAIADARERGDEITVPATPPSPPPRNERSTPTPVKPAKPEKPQALTPDDKMAAADDPAAPGQRRRGTARDASSGTASRSAVDASPSSDTAPPRSSGESDALQVVEIAIGTDIVSRRPTGVSKRFTNAPERLVCYTVVRNLKEPTSVTHVWRHGGKVLARVAVEVGVSSRWRTWSRKRLTPGQAGDYTCQVLDASGGTLSTHTVTVTPEVEAP